MPIDSCLVTVKAGPSHSRGYENFVARNLKGEELKEITSNLEEELKEEALAAFLETVKDGFSIKECIFKVQDQVLTKVPKERNKFFIKFTYDNQLQIEIGVNKFKNGNAQFYHKIGVAPVPKEITEKHANHEAEQMPTKKDVENKREAAMQELASAGVSPNRKLKNQTTNDRSAPQVSGRVSNPNGGWDDLEDRRVRDIVPPNPTNKQTIRELSGWAPDIPSNLSASSHSHRSVDPKRAGYANISCKQRSRSLGRPLLREDNKNKRMTVQERSVSPADRRHGRIKGALGDCFQTGLRPSQDLLHPSESINPVAAQIRRAAWNRKGNETTLNVREPRGNEPLSIKINHSNSQPKTSSANITKGEPQSEVFNIKINHAQTQEEESFDMEELDEEWDENQEKGLEIEDISGNEGNDTGYVSCEEKEKIFMTESPSIEEEYSISYPDCNERHYQNYENPMQTYHDKTKSQNQYEGKVFHKNGSFHFSQYPIKNLLRNGRHDQQNDQNQPFYSKRMSTSPVSRRMSPSPVATDRVQVEDGWYGPVVQKVRPVPSKCWGHLEINPSVEEKQQDQPLNSGSLSRKNSFKSGRRNSFNKSGWVEIPIQIL